MNSITYKILAVDDTPTLIDAYRKVFQSSATNSELSAMADAFADDPAPAAEIKAPFDHEVTILLDCFSQGLDAVAAVEKAFLKNEPYVVAFVDMRMPPGIDGLETMKRMWMIDPHLQVVICTAHHDYELSEIRAQAIALNGSFLIIRKPFDPEEVLQSAYTSAERAVQQRNQKAVYTILPGPELKIGRISPRVSTATALVFSDWVELADGTRRKVFKIGLDEIPDTPQKALENYIAHAPQGIIEMRKQVEGEEHRLHQARGLLDAFEKGKLSQSDLQLP
jgi:CheY-like chemotaxis protein